MNNRIKQIRKSLGLTQAEFGKRLGLKQNSIALIESGERNTSEQTIHSLEREVNVQEKWLRTGEGQPYIEMSKKERIARFLGEVMADEEESFRVRFFEALASYTPEDWKALERILSITPFSKNKEEDENK